MEGFEALLRRVESAISVLGTGPDARDAIRDRAVRDGASEEGFFLAWCAALVGRGSM